MANLLASADGWASEYQSGFTYELDVPPAFNGGPSEAWETGRALLMLREGAVSPGDTFDGILTVTNLAGMVLTVTTGLYDAAVHSQVLVNGENVFSFPALAGAWIGIRSAGNPTGDLMAALYGPFTYALSQPPPPPPVPCGCERFGRVTTIYASGHYRDRVHVARMFSGEKRCLVVDFNGAIKKGEEITSVKWRVDNSGAARLEMAEIDGAKAKVALTTGDGCTTLSCYATIGNHCQILVQAIRIEAERIDCDYQPTTGPTELVVTA